MFRDRVLPTILVFALNIPVTGALMVLLYQKGMSATTSAFGTLLHVPVVALLVAGLWAILIRLKKLTPSVAGLRWNADSTKMFAFGTLISVLGVVGTYLGYLLATGRPIQLSTTPASLSMLLWGLPALIGNAAIQQLPLQSIIVASADQGKKTLSAIIIGTLFFLLAHVPDGTAPIYLGNVVLFGLVTTMAFFRKDPRDYGFAIGFHGGWNYAQILLIGSPFKGQPVPSLLAWTPSSPASDFWTGGSAGYDAGVLFTFALLPALLWLLLPPKAD